MSDHDDTTATDQPPVLRPATEASYLYGLRNGKYDLTQATPLDDDQQAAYDAGYALGKTIADATEHAAKREEQS